MTTKTKYRYVNKDSEGIPCVKGTSLKVHELVKERKAYGWSPEEIYHNHPDLSLGQIYSALSYYWDHRDEIEREIEKELEEVKKIEADTEEPPWLERLQELKASR